jgi:MFS family permease
MALWRESQVVLFLSITRYRPVLSQLWVRRMMIAGCVAYLAIAAEPLALLFITQEATGSFAGAGLVLGAYGLSSALLAPLRGRSIDQRGGRAVVVIAAAHATLMIGLVLAAYWRAPLTVLLVLGALAGCAFSPVFATMRSVLAKHIAAEFRESAYALQAVTQELAFVGGPLLAGLLIAITKPTVTLITTTVTALVATALFGLIPQVRSLPGRNWQPSFRPVILSSAALRILALTTVPTSLSFGIVEFALPAYAVGQGDPPLGGLLLACIPAASLVGGLWYGSRRWRGSLVGRYLWTLSLLAGSTFLLVAAENNVLLAVSVVLMGLPIAPMITCRYSLLDRAAPEGGDSEAFMWISTSEAAGAALGQSIAGLIVQQLTIQTAYVAAGAAAVAAFLIALAGRRTLRQKA